MGCFSSREESFQITHHRYLAALQSHLPDFPHHLVDNLEKDIGNHMDDFYQRMITGKTRATESSSISSQSELYLYAGVIGLHYGFDSPQYKNVTENLIQYSNVDTKWITAALEGVYNDVTQPVTYSSTYNDQDVAIIPDECTILLLADFATGLPRSDAVLDEAKRLYPGIDLIIHGGDTYYSGSVQEQKDNLITPLQTRFPNAMIRCLRGNHDLYSGPKGFQYVQDTVKQQSTYFSLTNSYLTIQGMDTSVFDANPLLEGKTMVSLYDTEVNWHTKRIQAAKQAGKKVVLFSHHEPITYNDSVGILDGVSPPVNVKLYQQLQSIIPMVDAYYFGHQHGLMIYEDYLYRNGPILKKPRMIGHGGCPVMAQELDEMYKQETYDTSLFDVPTLKEGNWKLGNNGSVIDTGFVILVCSKGTVTANYYNIHSRVLNKFEPAQCVFTESI